MKFGVPWSVKGIRPEARETAREAARRSGMSLGEWLNTVILEQAAEAGVRTPDEDDEDYAGELASVHERLDDLTHRIAQFSKAPERQSRRRGRDERAEQKPDQIAQLIDRLDRRLEQIALQSARPAPMPPPYPQPYAAPVPQRPAPPALDRAVAEITARQRALRGEPPPSLVPQPAPAPMLQPVPQQNLTGLEDQLRRITDQIETLHRPGVEEAINALRDELGDIGRALNDAMPRRAIDTIERQIQGLTQRIAEGRQSGGDQHALSGVEQGLAEVRDALRGLTPAESLVGFNEAVSGLARKIDLIVAQKDPATLEQLEHAITTLRDMASHVASNDAIATLAQQVQDLGHKVEHLGRAQGGDALNHLEERIDALSRALAERVQNGSAVPPRLEALVQSLTDKVERIQESRGDPAIGHLEGRIVQLVERLDASDSRLGHLEAIERGLSDLLVQVEDMRSQRRLTDFRAEAESAVGVDTLKHDLARTQTTLEAVNGTLGSLVERLAKMERDFREGRAHDPEAPLELGAPLGKIAARAVSEMPAHLPPAPQMPEPQAPKPAPQPQAAEPAPAAKPKRAAPIAPIAPELPPDQPLEPGSGPPRRGARIAADAPQAPKKSSFIAAARRAAQTAVQEAGARLPKGSVKEPTPELASGEPAERKSFMSRVKTVLVAASVAAIVLGGVQIGWQFISGFGGGEKKTTQTAKPAAQSEVRQPATDRIASSPLSPVPMLPPPAATPAPPLSLDPDVTGTIPDTARNVRTPSPAERLPAEIGSVRLRTAAANGDAAAAYEIATRYSEGRGVIADMAEAARWYERAAGKGLALAQFRYATMLEKGLGVKKDLGQARRYYVAAAEKGNAKAMHNLAVLYAEGIEGKPDYANAVHWFRNAAMHGVPDSQYNLAVLAARGLGMPKNLPESCKWFALAAAQGDKEAERKRDEVAGKLDAKALAAVQRDAKAFKPLAQPAEATVVSAPPGGWEDPAPPQGQGKAGAVANAIKLGKR
jgi:localization factor PodJL